MIHALGVQINTIHQPDPSQPEKYQVRFWWGSGQIWSNPKSDPEFFFGWVQVDMNFRAKAKLLTH